MGGGGCGRPPPLLPLLRKAWTNCWELCGMAFVCLMSSCILFFLLTTILVKTMSMKSQGLYTKSFSDSAKDCYFLRFHSDSRNIFVNTSKGKFFFHFSDSVAKNVHMGWKFQGALKSSIPSFFSCTWRITYKSPKCIYALISNNCYSHHDHCLSDIDAYAQSTCVIFDFNDI